MKALIAATALGIAAIAVADLFGFTFARAATPPGITVEVTRPTCTATAIRAGSA